MKKVLLFICVISSSCSLLPDRSYNEIMDPTMEPVAFFKPRDDFRVVYGDEGNGWKSLEEAEQRTPPTPAMEKSSEYNMSLEQELYALELAQSEKQLHHYKQCQKFLTDISDKIYFLRIPTTQEREEYLTSKGFNTSRFSSNYRKIAAINGEVTLGMNKEEVSEIWGTPTRIDQAENHYSDNERWTYFHGNQPKFIYFKSGVVEGWTTNQ